MKNIKSTLAFIIFIAIYVYSIIDGRDANIIDVVGYIALWSSLFMMFRSDMTTELIGKVIDTIGKRK